MEAKGVGNRFKTYVSFIILIIFCVPSLIWSAGYEEQKLFDTATYSSKDLNKKIATHSKEINILDNQIKALDADIDWLVLKVNQIQDSGRKVDKDLKKSIKSKDKKIDALRKTKNRLESLVAHYLKMPGTAPPQVPGHISGNKSSVTQKKAKNKADHTTPDTGSSNPQQISSTFAKNLTEYNEISSTQLQSAVNKAGLSDWVEIIGTDTCLKIETTLPILFSSGSAKVAGEYKSFIKKLAAFLKPYDVKIQVNGYADTVPIHTKKYPSNLVLGAARAANIVDLFVKNGLKPSIFKIESSGEYRFASKGMSKQKSFERRAEVKVIFSG